MRRGIVISAAYGGVRLRGRAVCVAAREAVEHGRCAARSVVPRRSCPALEFGGQQRRPCSGAPRLRGVAADLRAGVAARSSALGSARVHARRLGGSAMLATGGVGSAVCAAGAALAGGFRSTALRRLAARRCGSARGRCTNRLGQRARRRRLGRMRRDGSGRRLARRAAAVAPVWSPRLWRRRRCGSPVRRLGRRRAAAADAAGSAATWICAALARLGRGDAGCARAAAGLARLGARAAALEPCGGWLGLGRGRRSASAPVVGRGSVGSSRVDGERDLRAPAGGLEQRPCRWPPSASQSTVVSGSSAGDADLAEVAEVAGERRPGRSARPTARAAT